ncbi:hypothetical protein [Spiroplasma alleghenense]|uniref:Uncharacterized protein n=1 Tax=Spiroplasma alleghenense TaxID=216931 RepID=A0A345Z525_9MOLU|nr:hypothetical protein [Spiroplasma alleghenense]AXK51704.1 hypothetical protein SALLE_v1c10340 [Spiroplasma alleghenense]
MGGHKGETIKKLLSLIGASTIFSAAVVPVTAMSFEYDSRSVQYLDLTQSFNTSHFANEKRDQAIPGIYDETQNFENFINDSRNKINQQNPKDFKIRSGSSKFYDFDFEEQIRDLSTLELLLKSEDYKIINAKAIVTKKDDNSNFFDFFANVVIDGDLTLIDLNGYSKSKNSMLTNYLGDLKTSFKLK